MLAKRYGIVNSEKRKVTGILSLHLKAAELFYFNVLSESEKYETYNETR